MSLVTIKKHKMTSGRRHWMRGAWFCAAFLVAASAQAGKPPHAGGGGKGGGGGDDGETGCGPDGAAAFAGRAFALEADIEVALLTALSIGPVSDTGELPSEGGLVTRNLAKVEALKGAIQASILDASTAGSGGLASSYAQTLGLDVHLASLLHHDILGLSAGVLQATTAVECRSGTPKLTKHHGSNIVDLELSLLGHSIEIPAHAPPNTDLLALLPSHLKPLVSGEIVLNEQKVVNGRQVVNALRVDIEILNLNLLKLVKLADVHLVVSHAESRVECGAADEPCACELKDWVTGGGWITLSGGAKGTFGLVGGQKANGLQGHLTYIDHRSSGPKIFGHTVTSYTGDPESTSRAIGYDCKVAGTADNCVVTVADNGEPGAGVDEFSIVSAAYAETGPTIAKGNIQLHKPQVCAVGSSGGDGGGDDSGGGGKGNGKGGKKK